MEAWNLVINALRNSGYDSQGEFDKLPQTLQRIFGSPRILREWTLIDTSQVQTVVQSNFIGSHMARSKREKEFTKMPNEIKLMFGQVAE